LRKNYGEIGGAQKFFIYFTEPADVKNMTFMVYKYADKDADRWLFVPALNMVKRIAAQDKTSSFVGSDFTYEDVSGRNIKDDKHELLKEESIDGKQCYMVKSTPIEKTSSYSYKLSWIDKKTLLPVKEEYHDLQGETARVFSADKIEDINGFPTITGRTMKNIQTGHRTEVTFLDTKYNVGIDDNLFSERYLSQPPAKWVK
ncbi:MAG: outer membrane lipoprotein-sorting protein, partial [Nitrospirae bacterium]|nr:outer membrane lipoprotein-sorting protein [Nitrospirota bacterium]